MDSLFGATWFIIFCLGVAVITAIIRRVVEVGLSNWSFFKNHNYGWTNIVLPSLPGALGGLIALFAAKYPYPDNITSVSARVMFGLAAGLLSGLVYRVVKVLVVNKVPADQQKDILTDK